MVLYCIFSALMKSELKKLWFKTSEKINAWRSDDPLMIAPYLSYANTEEIIIRGRVLENEGIVVHEDDGKWENFINSLKRMESDEAAHVTVQVLFDNKKYNCITNDEGFFTISIPYKNLSLHAAELTWSKATVLIPDYLDDRAQPISAVVKILMPNKNTKYAIITDMDDTILESHVNSFLKLRLLYETFLKNVHSRLAFENIGNVLQTITRNKQNQQVNPIFFLSHSPWNLYELLIQFIKKNNIPSGPFFLRDFGYKRGQEKYEHENHKALALEHLINFYPNLKFILLGDATEHDVDIYLQAFLKFPGRILKIIIRATEKEKKNDHVKTVIAQNPGAPIHLIEHSDEILEIVE